MPWLILNLLTAFLAAAVVGLFEGTLQQIVVLAVFLPVLAGQSGNTGCQALAVTLRGMTLGELRADKVRGDGVEGGPARLPQRPGRRRHRRRRHVVLRARAGQSGRAVAGPDRDGGDDRELRGQRHLRRRDPADA